MARSSSSAQLSRVIPVGIWGARHSNLGPDAPVPVGGLAALGNWPRTVWPPRESGTDSGGMLARGAHSILQRGPE